MTRLRLAGLAPAEVAELVADQVPAGSAPDPVAAVVRAADGNLLHALELAGTGARVPPASINSRPAGQVGRASSPASGLWWTRSASPMAGCRMICWPLSCRSARTSCWPQPAGPSPGGCWSPPPTVTRSRMTWSARSSTAKLLPGGAAPPAPPCRRSARRAPRAGPGRAGPALAAGHAPDLAAPAALLAARRAVSARAYPEADHFYAMAVDGADWRPRTGPGPAGGSGAGGQLGRRPERAAGYTAGALAGRPGAGAAERARILERLGRYRWSR